jgi:acetolactate synthase-1/2/3 large subunit
MPPGVDSFRKYAVEEREKVIEPDIHPKDGPLLMGEVVNVVVRAD